MVPSSRETVARPKITPKPKQMTTTHVDLSNMDQVLVNAHSSHGESRWNIFEDNEAVIKMIIKGRSPTMRHVSGTHRVALDWLFNGINLDPKIQIKYVDIKNLMTDLWTKGSFTRDEWNNLLHLLDIMNLSTFSRSHFFQTESRVLWYRKDPKKVFPTIRRRWRRSQERRILCRIETCSLRGRILKMRVNLSGEWQNTQTVFQLRETVAGKHRWKSVFAFSWEATRNHK